MDNAKPSADVNAIADTRNLVTAVKLKELYLKRKEKEDYFLPILSRLQCASSEKEKLQILVEEHQKKNSEGYGVIFEYNSSAPDLLAMAEHDPTISEEEFKSQRLQAEENIRRHLRKAQYASLFGSIFNEWMNFEGKADVPDDEKDGVKTPKSDDESTVTLSSDLMGRPEKYAQKAELESIIFAPDPDAKPEQYAKYLEELFRKAEEDSKSKKPIRALDDSSDGDGEGTEEEDGDDGGDNEKSSSPSEDSEERNYLGDWYDQTITLRKLRGTIGRFSGSFRKHTNMTIIEVKQSIHALVSGELLTEAKKAACKEILLSTVILNEIAMVLTLRLREVENWKYSEDSVQMNFRRHLNGKYRCYADESLLDAIFLQWIGVKWGIELRRVLQILHSSPAWLRPINPIDEARQEVRSALMPDEPAKNAANSIAVHEKTFMKEFFLTLLPESLYDFRTYNEDGEKADQEKKDNEKIRRARNEELKQMLLQRLLIDRQYAEAVNPGKPFTVVQTDAYRFAQSQSHEIILKLMELIGVTKHWLKFFKTFLSLPARFEPGGEVRVSKRGVPIRHPLGLVFGEVQLFLMEFAVNRATGGKLELFRMHDDFWWWSEDEALCETAWNTIQEYSTLTGTNWNLSKSGCVRITSDSNPLPPPPTSVLPTGEISWGFITLNSDGIWRIKKEEVQKHTEELRVQLASQKSILGLIGAYNRYMKFFVRNFAKPVRAFGKQHVDQIIAAINQIHLSLFPDHNGDILSYIISIITNRFSDELPPEPILPAWLLIPVQVGGLGVRNVLFDIHPLLKAYKSEEENAERSGKYSGIYNPQTFKQCLKKDKHGYELQRERWLKSTRSPKIAWDKDVSDDWFDGMKEWLAMRERSRHSLRRRKPHPFITFDEFILGRRGKFSYWGDVWDLLTKAPTSNHRYGFPESIKKGLSAIMYSSTEWLKADYSKNTPYWRVWLLAFGDSVLDYFGEFRITDEGRLPVAMIDIYTNLKTKWDQ